MAIRRRNKKKVVYSSWSFIRKLLLIDYFSKLKHADRLSFLALFISIFSVLMSMLQFKEAQRQFRIQQLSDNQKDSIDNVNFNKQIDLLKAKNQADVEYYSREVILSQIRDSLQREQFKIQLLRTENKIELDKKFYKSQENLNFKQLLRTEKKIELDKNFYQSQERLSLANYNYLRTMDSIRLDNAIANQRLSVQPLISSMRNASLHLSDEKPGFYLTNGGLGPALISNISLYYKGYKLEKILDLSSFVINYPSKFYKDISRFTFTDKVDSVIVLLPNQVYYLFSSPSDNIVNGTGLGYFMDNLKVEVDYKSFYGDRYHYIRKAKYE